VTFAFAAAGTGGHVYPALAVADALVGRGVPAGDIVFFGGDRMEAATVPAAGYDFIGVDIHGLRRSMSRANLELPGLIRRATNTIEHELRSRDARVMTVFGGYVSVPAARAAMRTGAKLFVQEQNAVPGLANRLVARRAVATFVAFPDAAARLHRAVPTGNPLRSTFASFDRAALRPHALERYGLPDGRPVLGVLGGSLGARVLNRVTERIAADAEEGSIAIVHLTGKVHFDDIAPTASRSMHPWVAVAFENEMEYFYAAADLVLSRSGALTISELAATGTPGIVVPYAAGTGGHQGANAAHLQRAGGVIVIPEDEIDRVSVELQQLLLDGSRRSAMAAAARREGRPDAAEVIARTLLEAADG
jgi:UDP-N-acetylglucosamine--N-acetylmuramyl-(pentapeptide) pyrophosphoryl-undecaprenol N-acetylglucosamine transferase